MTNAQIIMIESVKLMEDGIIKGSGVFGETPDGKKIELPESIHTFAMWKSLGFQVKKGQHAVTKFPIWKYTKGKKAEAESNEEEAEKNQGFFHYLKRICHKNT